MRTHRTTRLVDGFVFLEGPRWYRDRLWVSDMWAHTVYTVTTRGERAAVCRVEGRPSGLGFGPDGSLLIVSMADRSLLRLVNGELERVADLSPWATGDCNDMVTDARGRCYVGNFGYDLLGGAAPAPARLICVEADGSARPVADDLTFPNGAVIGDGGRTLVVAETFANRLTAFDIAPDGGLSNRRCYAALGEHTPDGICLDIAGGIWVASFATSVFLRVEEGGAITDAIEVPGRRAVACQLGGDDGRTLFCLTYAGTLEDLHATKPGGAIEIARVEHPAAGSP